MELTKEEPTKDMKKIKTVGQFGERMDELIKAKRRAYFKAYGQTPERKAYQKAYMKEYRKAYRLKPEYKAYRKAYQKAYQQTPEQRVYQKAYRLKRKQERMIINGTN